MVTLVARILFSSPPFEEVCHKDNPIGLCAKYIGEVAKVSSRLSTGDILVLILVGHVASFIERDNL